MAVYESFSYSPTELAVQLSSATQDTLVYLLKNDYITNEQYTELSGKLAVMAVPNKRGFGKRLLDYWFGEDNDNENAWVFPIVEVANHYKSAMDKDKPKNVTKLKAKPKLEVVKDDKTT